MAMRKFLTGLSPRPPATPSSSEGSASSTADPTQVFARRQLAGAMADSATPPIDGSNGADDSTGLIQADAQRMVSTRRECRARIEQSREYFERILGCSNPGATVEDFVRGLEDGRFLLSIANRVSGVLDKTSSKLEGIGIAGVSVDNFDRYGEEWW